MAITSIRTFVRRWAGQGVPGGMPLQYIEGWSHLSDKKIRRVVLGLSGAYSGAQPGWTPTRGAPSRRTLFWYCVHCHKWLYSAPGSAFLYARPEVQHVVEPLVVSWGWNRDTKTSEVSEVSDAAGPGGLLDLGMASSRFVDENEWQGGRDPAARCACRCRRRSSSMGRAQTTTGLACGRNATPAPLAQVQASYCGRRGGGLRS